MVLLYNNFFYFFGCIGVLVVTRGIFIAAWGILVPQSPPPKPWSLLFVLTPDTTWGKSGTVPASGPLPSSSTFRCQAQAQPKNTRQSKGTQEWQGRIEGGGGLSPGNSTGLTSVGSWYALASGHQAQLGGQEWQEKQE